MKLYRQVKHPANTYVTREVVISLQRKMNWEWENGIILSGAVREGHITVVIPEQRSDRNGSSTP